MPFSFSSFSKLFFLSTISGSSSIFISFSFLLLLLFNLFALGFFVLNIFIVADFFFKVWKVWELPVLIFLIFFTFFVFVFSSIILKSDIVLFNIAELFVKSNSKFF